MTPKSIEARPVNELEKLKWQFQEQLNGYRQAKYQIYASTMAEVVKLRADEDELAAFLATADIERPEIEPQNKNWITLAAVSFVTHNKQLAWKGARVLDYLYDIKKVPLNKLASKIRKLGGIEKIVKIAAEKDPRRKAESEAGRETEKPSRQKKKNRLGRLGRFKAETPDLPQYSSEDSEIVISISPELRKKLDAMNTEQRVKLICARSDKSGWIDVMLEVHEVRLLKR
jgi:hypothetical protein